MATLAESFLHHLLPSLTLLYLVAAPFTKVEESFNIQATHDILTYGVPTSNTTQYLANHYDHVSFPGSVPRTFTGAVVLAGLTSPFTSLLKTPEQRQILVRAVQGFYNAFSLLAYGSAVTKTFGRTSGNLYLLMQASQFHIMFYASRTLPNMFAFGLTILAMRSILLARQYSPGHAWYDRHVKIAVYAMTFTGVVFRSEIAILLATHVLYLVVTDGTSTLRSIVPAGLLGAVVGLITTVSIDSFFWQRFPLWPEWVGFYYNTLLGRSSEWGVSPWHYYFTTAIPRTLLNPIAVVLVIATQLTPATRSKAGVLIWPNILFTIIYSFLPHKEWRFIIYSIPPLTAAAAASGAWLWDRRRKNPLYFLLACLTVGSVIGSFAISGVSVAVSSLNYPGGAALARLHELTEQHTSPTGFVKVHLDNLACQTGVTRFLQRIEPEASIYDSAEPTVWKYDKTGDKGVLLNLLFWADIDFALAEEPARIPGKWEVLDVIHGFDGLQLLKPSDPLVPGDDVELHLDGGKEVHAHRAPHPYQASWYKALNGVGSMLRPYTRGYWLTVRMAPKIWILQHQRGAPETDSEKKRKWF